MAAVEQTGGPHSLPSGTWVCRHRAFRFFVPWILPISRQDLSVLDAKTGHLTFQCRNYLRSGETGNIDLDIESTSSDSDDDEMLKEAIAKRKAELAKESPDREADLPATNINTPIGGITAITTNTKSQTKNRLLGSPLP
ncbi:hypothetical protein TSMEX_007854 [Taenia solium]|eukprot:TsM_000837000 transcript=TsM_000837000 gene=TsM_000837000